MSNFINVEEIEIMILLYLYELVLQDYEYDEDNVYDMVNFDMKFWYSD